MTGVAGDQHLFRALSSDQILTISEVPFFETRIDAYLVFVILKGKELTMTQTEAPILLII
jgi:hypothetical protein